MIPDFDAIQALTRFPVGTINGRDAMMVIELVTTANEISHRKRHQMPIAMTPALAQKLGQALLLAAEVAQMGSPPNDTLN